ncbi:ABC transporter permease subunit [Gordonia sp. NPDC003585]|uniref:ABC transporter permease subunit n=1 Tax=Gordonia sp. NPDC003585 TaxID=3154275 RepID=UPI0033B2DE7A
MRFDLERLDLRLRRRMVIGTAVGAALYLLVIVALYPSFKDDTSLDEMLSSNSAMSAMVGISGSITSPEGWLNANMYANIGPLLVLLLTIGYGAASVAGQDADGSLGVIATLPISRRNLLAHKLIALFVAAAVVPLASVAICLLGPLFELTPDWSALLGVTLTTTLLGFLFGALAMSIGAATGKRGMALGIASGVAAAAYLISSLASVVDLVHKIRWISPFYWSVGNNQIVDGIDMTGVIALIAAAAALSIAAIAAFERLDIH